ncbi:hypothetical protein [Enterococcus raffinosus]|uniref:Integral membrane protein n=1 Tax=Enterococcus raffinosus TaxID=71452 RepID=A0AAW8T1J7_9ENTE|nr:hypothetical protein [Enterococcus raffinosus]MDT2522476.1 hypothetical protein [Enterococcus raffinosus]MDT2530433.1 hypothetical protein [Enterococcus raffinosus]MDT2533607.1 hypothetical protein [Enterococcus raffinosus]MDT2543106.1 hypothetical protein [Enterococcus raffinosus]MDT2553152.1 hypothetical protein [Enterococcus raffinosus]
MDLFSIVRALIFGMIAVLTLLVTLGLPLGEFTMGGKYKFLPDKMRFVSDSAFVLQLIAALSVLYVGEIISLNIPFSLARGICIFFGFYLLLNTGMNLMSFSKKEKYVMTPLALIGSICFFATVFL